MRSSVAGAVASAQPVADAEPRQPQALLLGLKVDLLGRKFLLELALQVVEEVVPAHALTLRGPVAT